jgi:hypothetical protein
VVGSELNNECHGVGGWKKSAGHHRNTTSPCCRLSFEVFGNIFNGNMDGKVAKYKVTCIKHASIGRACMIRGACTLALQYQWKTPHMAVPF